MEKDNTFQHYEMPYSKLDILGINPEMADKLPADVKRSLVNGQLTPLMEVSITASNGTVVTLPLKLQLGTDKNGESVLMAYPMKREISEKTSAELKLSGYEEDRLKKGEVITKTLDDGNQKIVHFIQLDPETKALIKKPAPEVPINEVMRNIDRIDDIQLGQQQQQQLREGKAVELNVGDEKVTVGVDLKEPQGYKVIKGDMDEWNRQQQMRYDIAHPEYIGLVQTEQNRWEYRQVAEGINPEKKAEQSLNPSGIRL